MDKFELEIIKYFRYNSTPFLDTLFQIITFIGEEYIIIAILAYIYFCYDKFFGEKLLFSFFISLGLNNIIKGIVKYERPFNVDTSYEPVRKETATGYSFPSGHTQNATLISFSLAIRYKKRWIWIVAIVVSLLIAFSRVYLGVHFPKDTLAGLILGIICALIGSLLYDKTKNLLSKKLILFGVLFIIMFPFLFIFYNKDFNEILVYKDFYISFALFLGSSLGIILENLYINFNCHCSPTKKALRFILSIAFILITKFGLELLLPDDNIFSILIVNFSIAFVALGLFPLAFKKLIFSD